MKENREDYILLGGANRRKSSKKLGIGGEGWEKKMQKQGGKFRGEETNGMDRGK
jgi:hypothetical protein